MMPVLDCLTRYGEVTKQGTLVYVAIPVICRTTRIKTLEAIMADMLSAGFSGQIKYDRPDYSSIGYILVENLKIMVKSAQQQGRSSAGLTNENYLVDEIHKYSGPNSENLVLRFVSIASGGRDFSLANVRGCRANENKKSRHGQNKVDMILYAGEKNLNFSIKKTGAERWQSADTYYGTLARRKLDMAVSGGLARLDLATGRNGEAMYRGGNTNIPIYRLDRELFWTMDESEKREVIYGKDVDYVIRGNFEEQGRVTQLSDGSLQVICDTIYHRDDCISGEEEPCWMIRNDATRNCLPLGIAGLRVEAVCRTRTIYGAEVKDV